MSKEITGNQEHRLVHCMQIWITLGEDLECVSVS